MRNIRTWKQKSGIEIDEVELDGERRAFVIYVGDKHACLSHVVSIYADSPEQSEEMRASLDAGEDARDWEDGNGNSVETLIYGDEKNGSGK